MSELTARNNNKKMKKEKPMEKDSVIWIGLYMLKVKPENLSEVWVAGEHQESNTGLIQLRWWLLHPCNIILSYFHIFSSYFSFIVFNMFTESINHKLFQGLFYLYLVKL